MFFSLWWLNVFVRMQSHAALQRLLKKHHLFLYSLYLQKKGRNNRTRLRRATKQQVWTILRLLFCISVGHIPLTRQNYERLVRSKRKNNLQSLRKRIRSLRKAPTEIRRHYIMQFAALYPFLFYDLFNKE